MGTGRSQIIGQLTARAEMSLILRSILLQNALQIIQPVLDWAGDSDCKPVGDGLAKQGLDNLEWLDPANPPPQSVTDPLNELFRQLPSMKDLHARVMKQRDAVMAATPNVFKVSGVVVRNAQTLSLTGRPDGPAAAYAIGNSGKLVQVATSDGTTWSVDNSKASDVSDGSVIFVSAIRAIAK